MSGSTFHHDHTAVLVRNANKIGEYFGAFPDREDQINGIANHIRKFWEPRMRRQLYEHVDGAPSSIEMIEIVRETVTARRAELEPKA
ncbi:MAG: formate dehydrogenase subunit delta [Leptothrix sp. (in: b-proteobacteria)]